MANTPNELFALAEDLFTNYSNQTEPFCRNIAGRSYYSCYHICSEVATKYGIPYDKKNRNPKKHYHSHKFLYDSMKNYANSNTSSNDVHKIRVIGMILAQCLCLRIKADYKINKLFTYNQSDDSIQCGRAIMQKSGSLLP